VRSITLDSLSSRVSRPLCLKIDVEGHELEVLRGAQQMLRSLQPFVIFEAIAKLGDDRPLQCKVLLAEMGYSLFYLRWPVLAPTAVDEDQLAYVADFLAVPADRIAMLRRDLHDFEVRPLTEAEVDALIDEQCRSQDVAFKAHGERLRARR
jgi:Methyltransferase FkbM domain